MGEHGRGTVVPIIEHRQAGPVTRYRVVVTMADGRRIWRRAATERQAEKLRDRLIEARELDLDPSRQTLAAWLRSWIASLRDAKRQRLAPRTLEHYAMIVERHIIPGLDPRDTFPLSRLSERRIQAWLDASDGSARTIHHHRAVLRLALNRALNQRLLVRNPAAGRAIELPDARWHGQRPLSFDEARALLRSSAGSRWHVLWRTALYTGLRLGELQGLTWDDIAGNEITVLAQMQRQPGPRLANGKRAPGLWVRRGTKTARAIERIHVDRVTADLLEAHHRRLTAERQPDWRYFGHVFINEHGDPDHQADVLRAFHAACDAAGIERRRFHDLRASHATLMRALDIPEDVRMARLGHETKAMARHYGQASERADLEAVERLAEAVG